MVSVEEGILTRKITTKGIYALVAVVCDEKYHIDITVEYLNPYGHLSGDYILLIPVNNI
jgi:hypothetical protein